MKYHSVLEHAYGGQMYHEDDLENFFDGAFPKQQEGESSARWAGVAYALSTRTVERLITK